MSLTAGTRLGPYVVTGPLGAGGMGEVYRGRDPRLDRAVAIKVLPAQLAGDPERLARFQREARAVAALNHPHIVTIYSVDEADGVPFLTMELIEGRSLDRAIPRGGLPADQILEIAGAMAEALSAAHERGIVHRDLKPGNVMVTADGRVKVLDFGLAKDLRLTGTSDATMTSADHTAAGIVVGTPAYMSPEQVAGRAVDHRTDLFSLGVVLHEMALGRRPFAGASSAELASAILRDTPAAVTDIRTDLPADLARIIRRCLEKDPQKRIQTAREVATGLREMRRQLPSGPAAHTPAPATTDVGSGRTRSDEGFWVAVLPFTYSSANADVATLADGLSEEIIIGLSRFSYLRVIARTSMRRYAGQAVDVRTVGREVGARYVIEGSVRQAGPALRISAQLVDASSGAHLWAETYSHALRADALFEVQDDVVPRIVSTVADWYGVLPRSMSDAVRSKPLDELSPYEALLRSFGYYARVVPDEHATARAVLERAVGQAPDDAAAWAMLSMLYGEEHRFGFNVQPDALDRSLLAARRAVDAAPSSHIAYLALAQAQYFRRDLAAFRHAAERAIDLNAMDGATIEYLAHLLAFAGDWERGCELGARARRFNPQHPAWYWALPLLDAYRQGDYQAARTLMAKAHMPGQAYSQGLFAAVLGQLGDDEAARSGVRELLALQPGFPRTARAQFAKWYRPDLIEHLIDGLRKAGLEVDS